MLKFIVVVYKPDNWATEQFRKYSKKTHGVFAKQLFGLRQTVQDFVATNPKRKYPGTVTISYLGSALNQ